MRNGVFLAVLLVLFSGCSDDDGESIGDPGNDGEEPVQPPPPPVTYRVVELFNDTLAFPSGGSGANDVETVLVPEGSRNVTVTAWRRVECPLTTYDGPMLVVTDPTGESTVTDVFPSGTATNTYTCPFVEPTDEKLAEAQMPGGPGEWSVGTTGECSCIVRVAVHAERPE